MGEMGSEEAGVEGAARGEEALGEGRGAAAEEQGTIASLLESALEEQLDAATVEEAEQGEEDSLCKDDCGEEPKMRGGSKIAPATIGQADEDL